MGCVARRVRVAAALALTALALQSSAADMAERDAAAAMEKFLARPVISHEYRGLRRLEASGVGQRGWLDAETNFSVASGLQYQVTDEGGSGYIRARVLRSLLDEERRLIALGNAAKAAITRENYQFTPEGIEPQGLAVVMLKPLRKDPALIIGKLFLSSLEGDLVRLEGRLAKNPSFWTTLVNIVRSYRRINEALMPVSLDTTAQLRLLGSSVLRMTYRYSHIDEQPVSGEHCACESTTEYAADEPGL